MTNVVRFPQSVHSEHLKLMRDQDPWSVPVRLLQPEHHEPLQDVPSEEAVLAYMLSNPGRVKSLSSADFTGRDRPVLYAALTNVPALSLEQLDMLDERLDCPGLISELRWQPAMNTRALRETIANVRRLSEVRKLAESVDAWRKRCATLTVESARIQLAKICFPRCGK